MAPLDINNPVAHTDRGQLIAILSHTGFFDIHPPLGKLILAFGARLLGYEPDPDFVIERVGVNYPAHVKYWLLRYVSAFFSVLTVPCAYAVARLLDVSVSGSVLSSTMVLFDFIGLLEGRLILMDSQLLFFCQLSLLFALLLWRSAPASPARAPLLAATGATAGLAMSIKHTALATPGLIGVISFFGLHFITAPLTLMEIISMVVVAVAVYAAPFYVMFERTQWTGGRYDNFMPIHFQRTLNGSQHFDPSAKRAPFYQLFVYLNRRMVASNAGVKRRHNWESKWYHWIINYRGVLFYSLRDETPADDASSVKLKTQLYLFGNPVVSTLILFSVALLSFSLCFSIRYRRVLRAALKPTERFSMLVATAKFLLFGWLANLLPYILVDRAAFIYHYLPGMFYGQLLTGVLLDILAPGVRKILTLCLIAAMTMALVYWAPWIYGLPLADADHARRRWMHRWN